MSGSSGSDRPPSSHSSISVALGVGREEGAAVGDRAHGVDQVGVGRALEHVAGRRPRPAPRGSSARRRASRAAARACSGTCARISRAACSPVMRGIDTSSTATSGRCDWVDSSAADAVLGLGHHLHVVLAVDQHAQAGADDAVVVGDQDADHAGTLQRDRRAAAGCGAHVQLAAHQPRALGHADQPEAARAAPPSCARSRSDRSRRRRRARAARRRACPRRGRAPRRVAPAWRATFVSASWATR